MAKNLNLKVVGEGIEQPRAHGDIGAGQLGRRVEQRAGVQCREIALAEKGFRGRLDRDRGGLAVDERRHVGRQGSLGRTTVGLVLDQPLELVDLLTLEEGEPP